MDIFWQCWQFSPSVSKFWVVTWCDWGAPPVYLSLSTKNYEIWNFITAEIRTQMAVTGMWLGLSGRWRELACYNVTMLHVTMYSGVIRQQVLILSMMRQQKVIESWIKVPLCHLSPLLSTPAIYCCTYFIYLPSSPHTCCCTYYSCTPYLVCARGFNYFTVCVFHCVSS